MAIMSTINNENGNNVAIIKYRRNEMAKHQQYGVMAKRK